MHFFFVEMRQRRIFVDFLRGLLKLNPVERWHPQQALQHPFITGKTSPALIPQPVPPPFIQVPSETSRITIGAPMIPQTRQRPRANTLSSLSLQDVPPQIQKITSANKGHAGVTKPAARQPPTEIPVDSEPPALPFEVGSVKSQGVLSPPGSSQAQPDLGKSRTSKQGYYVDRLATYTTNRRVSNPPGMMSIRTSGRRSQGRVDSLSLDEFPGPSSLPNVMPGSVWSSGSEPSSAAEQSPRRASASRRASDPFVVGSSGAQPIRSGRKGSLSSASGAAPPSSLSRSLTMSEMHQTNPSSTSMVSVPASGTGSSSSSSYNMDTLEEVSEGDDHHAMDAVDPLDKMDID